MFWQILTQKEPQTDPLATRCAEIPCGAWYRGPLYSFLEFGPGGPTRKIHQNNIKYYKHHDPSMYHELKHSFDMLSQRLEYAENYGTIVSPGCSGKYWHKRNHKQIPLQHDAQRSLVAHGIGAHCTHFRSLGPGVRRARYVKIHQNNINMNIMIHQDTMRANNLQKQAHTRVLVYRSHFDSLPLLYVCLSHLVTAFKSFHMLSPRLYRIAGKVPRGCSSKWLNFRNQKGHIFQPLATKHGFEMPTVLRLNFGPWPSFR